MLADPFLLLDHFGPTEWGPGQAIGAPDHPHRGFETVTYILEGRNEHRDSAGHHGVLGPGDVQWMTAGSGVVHAEMPEAEFRREGGLSHGFQIWVNLPARDKMMKPRYQEIPAAEIPEGRSADGRVTARVIAGEALGASAVIETRTPISCIHFTVAPGGHTVQPVPADHNALVYVFAGELEVGVDSALVREGELAVLGAGDTLDLRASGYVPEAAQALLLSGVPLREPVARWGPFVMNTKAEIRQAIADYQMGRMGQISR
jgi:redox-sensitive bicupin YhaK (pirin superfamily)